MNNDRVVELEVREVNLSNPTEEPFFVRERPIEAVSRRLMELSIPLERVAAMLDEPLKLIEDSLAEEIYCPEELLYKLLAFTGMEAVAVRNLIEWQDNAGHWFYGERCAYCGSNMYDVGIYGPYECQNSPK